jgi:hypothetical protein
VNLVNVEAVEAPQFLDLIFLEIAAAGTAGIIGFARPASETQR